MLGGTGRKYDLNEETIAKHATKRANLGLKHQGDEVRRVSIRVEGGGGGGGG